jgi:hypothetical protein
MKHSMEPAEELRRLKNRQAQRRYRAKEKQNRADVDEYVGRLESALYNIKAIADTEGLDRVASIANKLLNHAKRPDRATRPRPWRESLIGTDLTPFTSQSTRNANPSSYPGSMLFDSSQLLPVLDVDDLMLSCWDPATYPATLQQDLFFTLTSDASQKTSMHDLFIDTNKLLA